MAGQLTTTVNRCGISDLKVALRYLSRLPEVDPARLGAIGFCMGGGYALAWACTDQRLKATAPFYGANPRPLDAVARSCPVVGSDPERDVTARLGRTVVHTCGAWLSAAINEQNVRTFLTCVYP